MIEIIISNLKNIFVFAIFLGILVTVHEWGHFITAKKLGVKVEKFAFGFGPKLWSITRGGTEYLICLFPLGGYVKMAGDERQNCRGTPDEFFSQAVGRRSLIVVNGPVVNFLLAYVCFVFVFMLGYPDLSNKVGKLSEGYPAQVAGLLVGDQIVAVDAQPITNWTDLKTHITVSNNPNINFEVLRNGERLNITVTPRIERMKNIFGEYKETRLVGIVPAEEIILLKYGFFESFGKAGQELWKITTMTYKAIFSMLTGAMSAKENMGGPIFIFTLVATVAQMGLSYFLFILGVISANLAIFNLLPVIPLDGGHLFLFLVEKLRGKALSPRIDEYIARIGFGLIIALAFFVFYIDFERIGLFEKIKHLFF